jgi:hypothetical protein
MSGASVTVIHTGLSAMCHRYGHRPPILVFWSGGVHVTVTTDPDLVSDTVGASAGELAEAVTQYAAALTEWQQAQRPDRPAVTA